MKRKKKISEEEFLEQYEKHLLFLSSNDRAGARLILRNSILPVHWLSGKNLTQCRLFNCVFSTEDPEGSEPIYCRSLSLKRSVLAGCCFMGIRFHDTDFSYMDSANSDFSYGQFWTCLFASASVHDCSFRNSLFHQSSVQGATLVRCCFMKSFLNQVTFTQARLTESDFSGADWDYSSGIPLWCGGGNFTADMKLIRQYLAHLCTLSVKDSEKEEWAALREKLLPQALKSRRSISLGLTE